MTELTLTNSKKCGDCYSHTGDACDNSNSDHYGHMTKVWHQACGQHKGPQVDTKRRDSG